MEEPCCAQSEFLAAAGQTAVAVARIGHRRKFLIVVRFDLRILLQIRFGSDLIRKAATDLSEGIDQNHLLKTRHIHAKGNLHAS